MLVRDWFVGLKSRLLNKHARRQRRASGQRGLATRRLRLEGLEDRRLLAFLPAVDYSVGTNPQAVVSADFNGDGRMDLATANYNSGNVSVLLGNVGGTFQAAQNSPAGTNPISMATGDFNADGKADLAVANPGDVTVLLGNGNGTFQAPVSTNPGSNPASVAVGDFNGDGKLDLGVTSNDYYYGGCGYVCYPGTYVGHANVLLGNGAGSFSAPIIHHLGYGFYSSAVVADFNGDGKQDFASGSDGSGSGSYVSVLLGTGAGTLGTPNDFSIAAPRTVATGDLNGDGKLDLVTANSWGDSVSVLLGTGTGSFGAAQLHASGASPRSVAVADFNGDGKADLVTANMSSSTISVLLGSGTGAFRPPVSIATGTTPFDVVTGDFDGDGRVDVVSANFSSNNVSVLRNDGNWIALDAPSITISDAAAVTEGNIGTVSATFSVSLSALSNQIVTVDYATADGSATLAGGDYQAGSGTLTFAAGETTKIVTVLVNGDRLAESSESIYIRLTNSTNAFVVDALGAGTITDDEPHLSIDYGPITLTEGNSGATNAVFTVRLSNVYDSPVSVNYSTAEGDTDTWRWCDYYGNCYPPPAATSDGDFQAVSGTLTFAPGETEKSIPIAVYGDRIGEADEYFSVNLSNAVGGTLDASHAVGNISNDEPYASISYESVSSVVEGNTGTKTLTFDVVLSSAYEAPVTVDYTTVDGTAVAESDYVAAAGTLTFLPGQTSLPISVTIKGDVEVEDDEYFSLHLTGATSATIANDWGYRTIVDDDAPPSIGISDALEVEGNTGTRPMSFTVTLSHASDKEVRVRFATANGTAKTSDKDYVAKSGTLSFAPGESSKTVNVSVNGDKKKEKDEYFTVRLSNPTNGVIDQAWGYGIIFNDDTPPAIRIDAASVTEGNSGVTQLSFTVSLSHASGEEVRVRYATSNGTAKVSDNDYEAKSGTLTFAPGETTKTISIVVKGNRKKENDERLYVRLSDAKNGTLAENQGVGTILNDDK